MFQELKEINSRPKPFQFYTANELWTNEYTAKQMLQYHLNADIDRSSRNHAFIWQSVDWITAYFKVGAVTKIADFGCAVGLYSKLLNQGVRERFIIGCSISVPMLWKKSFPIVDL